MTNYARKKPGMTFQMLFSNPFAYYCDSVTLITNVGCADQSCTATNQSLGIVFNRFTF